MAWTGGDGWVWVSACVDHDTAEAWAHLAKVGDRFAALQPIYDAVIDRWGQLGPDEARGLALRHDWEPQYRSAYFTGSLAWLGITDSPALLGEPKTNGCAERWIRTLKDQCLWAQLHDTIDEFRQAGTGFVDRGNTSWRFQRHGHQTPQEAYRQHNPPQQHDRTDHKPVQGTECCSPACSSNPRPGQIEGSGWGAAAAGGKGREDCWRPPGPFDNVRPDRRAWWYGVPDPGAG
jgi:hypothetical protein